MIRSVSQGQGKRTRSLVRSELDLHVGSGRGIEGCGRGGLSIVVLCCGRACELIVAGILAVGIRCQATKCAQHRELPRWKKCLTSKTTQSSRPM